MVVFFCTFRQFIFGGDTPQWCVCVYAMLIVFWIFLSIFSLNAQPNIVSNCSFLSSIYLKNSAVSNQIVFINQTSISLRANYAFISSSISSFDFGLIYQYSQANFLVPFPLVFTCATNIHSCQLTAITTRDSEPIRVQLTPLNFTNLSNSMGLYLKQGRYQLTNCSINNQQQMTDPQTSFYIQIHYEKTVGSSCDPIDNPCGSPSLTTCSSSICTCLSNSSLLVSYSNFYYCADMLTTSNCQNFPSRCITWCNQTTNYLCICPNDTLKIQRNNQFICELPLNAKGCSSEDSIRQCSSEQCCLNEQCVNCSAATTTLKSATSTISFYSSSIEDKLRLSLGILAGILAISVLILLSIIYWLHSRKQCGKEKSISNTSTSSLYISPIQQCVQYPLTNSSYSMFSRTESFRHAVLSGHHQSSQIIEHVSTNYDSEICEKNHRGSSPTFSTLEYIVPTKETNVYQIILPSTPSLTHTV